MGIINTLTDFLCTALPAFIVLKLHMPLNKRLGVASLFLFGIVVNIASALRIYYTYYQYETSDTWYMVPPAICSILELGLGLVSYLPSSSTLPTRRLTDSSCVLISQSFAPLSHTIGRLPWPICARAPAAQSSTPPTTQNIQPTPTGTRGAPTGSSLCMTIVRLPRPPTKANRQCMRGVTRMARTWTGSRCCALSSSMRLPRRGQRST